MRLRMKAICSFDLGNITPTAKPANTKKIVILSMSKKLSSGYKSAWGKNK